MLDKLLFLLAQVVVAACFHHAVHNTQRPERVMGGQEAAKHGWKWQVSLQMAYEDDPHYFYHLCGGALLSSDWVLTAAHCVEFTGLSFRAALGEHDLFEEDGTEYFIAVDRIVVHESWKNTNIANGYDIALLHLSESAYDNGYVAIVQLPAADDILPSAATCYVTGWGVTQVGGGVPPKLQEAQLSLVPPSVCSQPEWWGEDARDNMICAGGDGLKSGCSGDSGGPLSCYRDGVWEVHGIVSYGLVPFCSTYQKPTVFTRVSAFTHWIYVV
ncbi:Trypsin-like serine protease, partial [Pristimantis euphronides]